VYYHYFATWAVPMLCLSFCHAQSSSTLIGARANSLGYASACIEDEWSLFNNIAGMSKVNKTMAAFTYDMQPSFKPFNKTAFVMAMPFKIGVAGIGVFRFGDKLYNEQIVTAGFSNTFGLASLGLKINYIQYNAQGFGTKSLFSVSFGGIARLTEKISLGAHIININQPEVSSQDDEKLPTILITGLAFKLSSKTFIATEIEKNLDYRATLKSGIEYQWHKKFVIRTGFNINPAAVFLGFGYRLLKFKLDYAYQHSFVIGSRHQATVGYAFNRTQQ
jgi:hypothetical protein